MGFRHNKYELIFKKKKVFVFLIAQILWFAWFVFDILITTKRGRPVFCARDIPSFSGVCLSLLVCWLSLLMLIRIVVSFVVMDEIHFLFVLIWNLSTISVVVEQSAIYVQQFCGHFFLFLTINLHIWES